MTTTTPNSTNGLDRFFDALHRSPMTRSTSDHYIAGVCGGLAQRLGVSAKVVRICAIVLALFGPALTVYLIAWALLPDTRGRVRLERALRGGDAGSIVLLVALGVVMFSDLGFHTRFGWFGWMLVTAATIAGVVALITSLGRSRRSTPVTPYAAPYTPPTTYATPPAAPYGPTTPGAPYGANPQPYGSTPQDAPRS